MRRFYRVDYRLLNADNEVVDTSEDGTSLAFIEGDGSMMPGLEAAVVGQETGDEIKVTIEPDQAYGLPQRSLIRTVSRETINANVEKVEPGMIFQVGSGDQAAVVRVVEVVDDGIVVDGNHPLAGVTFKFELIIKEAREATTQELEILDMQDPT
jgi:FKBP-type peptidyl-prolyl cis-trans isomerase SlyD